MDTTKPTPIEQKPAENKPEKVSAPAPEQKEKLNVVIWVLLGTGAVIIDLFQGASIVGTLGTVGTIVNILIDIFVGLSLATFFLLNGMLDWKLGISLILGFAVDFLTAGIAPAWTLDILYAWLVTDSSRLLGNLPMGELARQAALTTIQKGKNPATRGDVSSVKGFSNSFQEEFKRNQQEKLGKKDEGKSVDGIKRQSGNEAKIGGSGEEGLTAKGGIEEERNRGLKREVTGGDDEFAQYGGPGEKGVSVDKRRTNEEST